MISVIGLGRIGLPLAVLFASKGNTVHGIDNNLNVVESVNLGVEPYPGEPLLAEKLGEVVKSGHLTASSRVSADLRNSKIVLVAVPLVLDEEKKPDFSIIDSVTQEIAKNINKGVTVLYETTLPVGTTRNRIAPMLEQNSGLIAGKDFHLVFSPERVLTGRLFEDLKRYPKLVAGLTERCLERGAAFYESVLDFELRDDLPKSNGVWKMQSLESAEFTKLAETTYRDVNIALANQFALFAQSNGINLNEVRESANSQPYSHIHNPGIAVGGHCIPIYPHLYLWSDETASLVKEARRLNDSMPKFTVDLIQSQYGSLRGKKTLILGVAYRGNVKGSAYSGAIKLIYYIESIGGKVVVHDPFYSNDELVNLGFNPYSFGDPVDVAILQADHTLYLKLTSKEFPGLKYIFDGRGILDKTKWSDVNFHTIGIAD